MDTPVTLGAEEEEEEEAEDVTFVCVTNEDYTYQLTLPGHPDRSSCHVTC